VPYHLRAAEVAQQIYANAEAIHSCRRALALLRESGHADPQQALHLHRLLGDLLHFTGRYVEARLSYQEALRLLSTQESIQVAQLQRKIGNTWREQYHYQEALQLYDEAKHLLEETSPAIGSLRREAAHPQEAQSDLDTQAWVQEWLQLLFEMRSVYYWLGLVQEDEALVPIMQPVVEEFGSASQRSEYYRLSVGIEFRRNRSTATAEMVAGVRRALELVVEAQDQEKIPSAYFLYGFTTLWSGDAEAALAPCRTALQMAEETGDVSLQARALTYLAIALRQCEEVESARQCAEQAKVAAAAVQMPEYMATADANLAWVAFRQGQWAEALAHGRAALDCWHKIPSSHASTPFQWTALWPLLAVAAHQGDFAAAAEYARALLDPTQQPLPHELTSLLEPLIQAHARGEGGAVAALLQEALVLAAQRKYL
jgi:tetratricopeptide (TPR) repeat protein